jgi:ribose 5-phosphate isomerase A
MENSEGKKAAAEMAVSKIGNDMTVGLGSGSTASYAIHKLGERVKAGLKIKAVATSEKSAALAGEYGIVLCDPGEFAFLDIDIDGADEVDEKGNLIKGGGGSLLREKVIAFGSKRFYVMVDDSKMVQRLGRFALPVEVIPFATGLTMQHLRALGCEPAFRQSNGRNFVSDNGNFIADCRFNAIDDPAWLDVKIKMIPGVVETGLFSSKVVTAVLVGYPDGKVREIQIHP